MEDNPAIEASGLMKRYGRNKNLALKDVNLRFRACELVAIIGPNGAGKSTLFDILGGLIKPTAGAVRNYIDSSRMGWCPQREIIDWSLTVRQNIMLGLDLRTGRFHNPSEVEEIAATLGLGKYLEKTAETLSGGELRRTQIARALIGDPALMILDEPTTGLDPSGIETVFEYLQAKTSAGATALVSTHETSKFARYCTRVVAIKEGAVIADMPIDRFMEYAPESNDLWDAFQVYAAEGGQQ